MQPPDIPPQFGGGKIGQGLVGDFGGGTELLAQLPEGGMGVLLQKFLHAYLQGLHSPAPHRGGTHQPLAHLAEVFPRRRVLLIRFHPLSALLHCSAAGPEYLG